MKEIIFTPAPNGDQDQGRRYLSAAWTLVMLAFISTAARVLVRSRLTRNMGADDYWMIVTMISNLVGLGFVTGEVTDGLGRHMYYLQPDQRRRFQLIGWLDWMQTFITIMFCKISICLFLLRIKNTANMRRFMYAMIALNVTATIIVTGLFIGICSPPKAYWDVGVDGKCFSRPQIMGIVIAQGIFSALTDIVLATTPILFLRNLQISKRTKIALFILMGAGYLTASACIVRTALSGQLLEIDETFAMVPNAAWRATEVNLGIICADAPIARPLYLFYRGRLRTLQEDPGSKGSNKSRLWPGSSKRSRGIKQIADGTDPNTGYTDASVEMGMPIEGYMRNGAQNTT